MLTIPVTLRKLGILPGIVLCLVSFYLLMKQVPRQTGIRSNLSNYVMSVMRSSGTHRKTLEGYSPPRRITTCPSYGAQRKKYINDTYGTPLLTEARHVMFNSVPKSGSRSLVWIMWSLASQYQAPDPVYIQYMLDTKPIEQRTEQLMSYILPLQHVTFIHGHVRYIELPQEVRPFYVSILRNPYSRYISWYYFMRYGDNDMGPEQLSKQLGPEAALPNETLNDCFRLNRRDCQDQRYYRLNIVMFCGHNPKCEFDPEFALAKAKDNVRKYVVIGIMEEYLDTIKAMEILIPTVFGGAVDKYLELNVSSQNTSRTSFKDYPSPEYEALMRSNLKYDMEFYQFVKQRFHRLKTKLGIGTTHRC